MKCYYNEFDPFCLKWLENLGRSGHIAEGTYDSRSIKEVRPADLAGVRRAAHPAAAVLGGPLRQRATGKTRRGWRQREQTRTGRKGIDWTSSREWQP